MSQGRESAPWGVDEFANCIIESALHINSDVHILLESVTYQTKTLRRPMENLKLWTIFENLAMTSFHD
jgi:hypothetical protein